MDSVMHFEIPAANVNRARKFYKGVFGWGMVSYPKMDYTILRTTPVDKKTRMPKERGAINGGMMKRSREVKSPVITVVVSSIDASAKKIAGKGGKIIVPKTPIPGMGFSAYFKDTEGNVMGLFQPTKM
ncbi:MAG TPA: VOC family protein [Candidatus Micrarchaeota archaeon]|nr:VOC family protein [Candidatus Micrarchaeota archaeon]